MVIHGALYRIPQLKVAVIEAGSKWMFPLLDGLADVYKKTPESFPGGDPVEEIKNRIHVSPFYEDGIDDLISLIGVDRVLLRVGLSPPRRAGAADALRRRAAAPARRRSSKDHGRQPGSTRLGVTDRQPWQTIPEMVLSTANRFGDAEAVVDGPLRLTFTELVERIRCAAGAFADLGVGKGERVAIGRPTRQSG